MYLALDCKDGLLAHAMAQKGLLPMAGGWCEQPYHWIQVLDVIGAVAGKVERERIAALRNKNNDTTLDL